MTRAIVEGAVYALRDAYGAVADLTGPATSVVLAGGGARSSLWRQSVADIFGLTVVPAEQPDLSAMGAAILAMAGITGDRATDIAAQWATFGRPVEPIARNQARFERLRPVFGSMYDAHRTQFVELARPD
jgi:sugar (pentulose or hexulose) kinase